MDILPHTKSLFQDGFIKDNESFKDFDFIIFYKSFCFPVYIVICNSLMING